MWDIFKDWIFDIIQFFYNFCHDWGLAIIIVTIIFRIIVAPLMHKQAKSNYAMQKVQPKIQALKDRFPDDPTRQSQEMQKIYAEMKFNPLAGCLPMLLQMPIFILIVGLIYWIEIISVIIQVLYFKKTGGKRFFRMAPIHHHFELGGWSETRVVAVFSIITAILCLVAFIGM